MASGSDSHRRVLPSMSVKRNVRVPVARSTMVQTYSSRRAKTRLISNAGGGAAGRDLVAGDRPAQNHARARHVDSDRSAREPAFCVPLYWSFLASVGSQVGSHSRWTATDGDGRLRTANRLVADGMDCCGRLWTGCVHLRIRRLGIRVPPGVPASPVRKRFCRVSTDGPYDLGSHSHRGERSRGPAHTSPFGRQDVGIARMSWIPLCQRSPPVWLHSNGSGIGLRGSRVCCLSSFS